MNKKFNEPTDTSNVTKTSVAGMLQSTVTVTDARVNKLNERLNDVENCTTNFMKSTNEAMTGMIDLYKAVDESNTILKTYIDSSVENAKLTAELEDAKLKSSIQDLEAKLKVELTSIKVIIMVAVVLDLTIHICKFFGL